MKLVELFLNKYLLLLGALLLGGYIFLSAGLVGQVIMVCLALVIFYGWRRAKGEDAGVVFRALGWCSNALVAFGVFVATNRWGRIAGATVGVLMLAAASWGSDGIGLPLVGWPLGVLVALYVGNLELKKKRPYVQQVEDTIQRVVLGHSVNRPPRITFGEGPLARLVGRHQPVGAFSFWVPPDVGTEHLENVGVRLRQRLPAAEGSTWGFEWDLRRAWCGARVIPDLPRKIWHPYTDGSFGNPLAPKGDPYRIPLGVTYGDEVVYWEPAKSPHCFVVGATGGGKSVFILGVMEHCFLHRHDPAADRAGWLLYLVDLKRTELSEYARYPGVIEGLGRTHAEALDVVTAVWRTMDERQTEMEQAGVQDLEQLNAVRAGHGLPPLPRVLAIFDEVGILLSPVSGSSDEAKERKAIRDEVELKMKEVGMLGRSMGVHLLYSTQRTRSDTIPMDLRMNTQCRLGLGKLDSTQSHMVFESDIADKMRGGKGRGIAYEAGELKEIQTYYIEKPQLRDMLGVS